MIRTVWVWCVGILLTVVLGSLLILISFVDSEGRSMRLLARLWARGILSAAGVRVQVRGIQHLPQGCPVILASNHQGMFDIFALFAYLPVSYGWIAKKELYRIPIFGYAMKRFGNIRMDRSNRDQARKSLAAAAQRIRDGRSILIFPEGTRSRDGHVLPFKKGCYYLAEASGAPVVPISISGSFDILRKGSVRIRPGVIHMVIGRPLRVERQGAVEDRNGFLERLRRTVIENQVRT